MPKFSAGGKILEADLFVLDKDGLMFDSEQFWIELLNERVRAVQALTGPEEALSWAHLTGGDTVLTEDGGPETTYVEPLGICAVAPPHEEIAVTAGFLVSVRKMPWHEARDAAAGLFERCNHSLDLRKALRPQPGFVKLMRRFAALDVPYGVATSDTWERTKASMELYGAWDKVRFVVTPEDVKASKPAPDMLFKVSELIGVPTDRIAMIGDSYVDVKMAAAAESIGIGVSADPDMRSSMEPFAAAVLNSLEDLIL